MVSVKAFFKTIDRNTRKQLEEYSLLQGFTLESLLKRSKTRSVYINNDLFGVVDELIKGVQG